MAKGITTTGRGAKEHRAAAVSSASMRIAKAGVADARQFRDLMSSLMTDVIKGHVAPDIANASCNAAGKLLKMVELEYKYGRGSPHRDGGRKAFQLASVG